MTTSHTIGLGEPEPEGKRVLFQPPINDSKRSEPVLSPIVKDKTVLPSKAGDVNKISHRSNVRTTINLTHSALQIIQGIQQAYRFKTGKVLPLWIAVSQAIEYYGQSKGKKS